MFIIVNTENVNTWEYGVIAQNIIAGKGYSLFYFEGDNLNWEFKEGSEPYKSAYMPPGYTLLILPAFLIGSKIASINIIFAFHLILSAITCLYLFKLTTKMFGERAAIIAALIYAILPEFIYAAGSISPVIIFHFLIVIFFNKVVNIGGKSFWFPAIILAVLLLFRMEVILLIIILIIYFLLKKNFKNALILTLIPAIILIPWQIRNFYTFDEFVPLTTSGGQNLYRGHNPYEPGVWADSNTVYARLKFINSPNYEIEMNNYYISEASNFLFNNLLKEFYYSLKKFFSFWLLDFNDKRSFNTLYLIPWCIILLPALFGLIKYKKSDYIYYLIYLIYFTSLVLVFFALPRYQTMMKIILVPFSAYTINYLINRKQE